MEAASWQLRQGNIGGHMAREGQRNSVHPPVLRSLKRTHDVFAADYAEPIPWDQESHRAKRAVPLRTEYGPVLNVPTPQENLRREREGPSTSWDPCGHKQHCGKQGQKEKYTVTVRRLCQPAPAVPRAADIKMQRMPRESAAWPLTGVPPASQKMTADWTAAGVGDIYRHAGRSECSQPPGMPVAMGEAGGYRNSAFMPQEAPAMPKPQWHPPWKLFRVISGHLGWVRCIAVEPGNQWFATGSADKIIKIWDLANGKLKLSLTGHIGAVRGVIVDTRSPHLFSCGGSSEVKCWDLEYQNVIRDYHGHVGSVHALDLHPTLDVLVTCGTDSKVRVWDARTKISVYTLSGHTDSVATVKCPAGEPDIITGSYDTTIRLWDVVAGRTRVTLTNHKASARTLVLCPRYNAFASGSSGNIKQWTLPDGGFIQNLSGHDAIINTLAVNSLGVLVSGAGDGSLHLWDWRTGYNFQRLQADVQPGSLHSDSGIFACVFDQLGSRLLTAEADKTIKVYKEDDAATEETHPVRWNPEIIQRRRF